MCPGHSHLLFWHLGLHLTRPCVQQREKQASEQGRLAPRWLCRLLAVWPGEADSTSQSSVPPSATRSHRTSPPICARTERACEGRACTPPPFKGQWGPRLSLPGHPLLPFLLEDGTPSCSCSVKLLWPQQPESWGTSQAVLAVTLPGGRWRHWPGAHHPGKGNVRGVCRGHF